MNKNEIIRKIKLYNKMIRLHSEESTVLAQNTIKWYRISRNKLVTEL